jgi:Transposase IS116/IS110/IS902 family
LLELVSGGAKKYLSAPQARALLGTVRPRDIVGRTRRQLASELVTELAVIDKKVKDADRQLTELVKATGSTLQQLHGIGPSGAARLLGDIADVARFASRGHFASWNGTAPAGCLLRRPDPSPAVPRRQPAHQPGPAHHGRRPTPPRHRRPTLLPAQACRRQDLDGGHALPEETTVRSGLPADGQRRRERWDGSGRTPGSVSAIQRG